MEAYIIQTGEHERVKNLQGKILPVGAKINCRLLVEMVDTSWITSTSISLVVGVDAFTGTSEQLATSRNFQPRGREGIVNQPVASSLPFVSSSLTFVSSFLT